MKEDAFKKIESVLYIPETEALEHLTPNENERRKRWVHCITQKMEDPLKPDKKLVDELVAGFDGVFAPVSTTTAYRDLAAVQKIIGNIQLSAKSWYRYMIIEGAKKAYEIAETERDARGMASALDKIGKYTMADKPDNDFDWKQMIPLDIEPAADPDLLENIEPIDNLEERRRELRKLWKGNLQSEAIDITPEE